MLAASERIYGCVGGIRRMPLFRFISILIARLFHMNKRQWNQSHGLNHSCWTICRFNCPAEARSLPNEYHEFIIGICSSRQE